MEINKYNRKSDFFVNISFFTVWAPPTVLTLASIKMARVFGTQLQGLYSFNHGIFCKKSKVHSICDLAKKEFSRSDQNWRRSRPSKWDQVQLCSSISSKVMNSSTAMKSFENGKNDHSLPMVLNVVILKISPSSDLTLIFLKSGGQYRLHLLQADPCSPP